MIARGRSCLFEAQTSQTDGSLSLLHALARLVSLEFAKSSSLARLLARVRVLIERPTLSSVSALDEWTRYIPETVSESQVSRDGALVTGVTLQASVRLDVHLPLR